MTTPSRGYGYGGSYGRLEFSRLLLFIGTVLFVLAAFAAGGHPLAGIGEWSWGFGAFASWMLAGAV